MPSDELAQQLRPGLLAGRVVAMAAGEGEFGNAVDAICRELGATVEHLPAGAEEALAGAAEELRERHGKVDALVCDGAGRYVRADPGADGLAALRDCVDSSWDATRAVANAAFIPDERGGKVVLIAPRVDGDAHAEAARAALENTARTLSIEWARYAITTAAIAPGTATTPEEVATLIAFIVSEAGDYYSGCIFELGNE